MQHHARCIIGDFERALLLIPKEERTSSLDVSSTRYTQFTIDDARALTYASSQRPIEAPNRVFILGIMNATLEAQNALLKLLEEPAPTTRFYIIIPFENILIPTVRSRLMVETLEGTRTPEATVATEFLALSYNDRLLEIARRTKDKDDVWCDALIRGIEVYVRTHGFKGGDDLLFVEEYIRGSGASKKMLLEHLALTL